MADCHFELLIYIKTIIGAIVVRCRMVVGYITTYAISANSPVTLWVRIPVRRCAIDTSLCYEVCQWLAAGRFYFQGTPVSPTDQSDRHDITEILLNMGLITINQTKQTKRSHWFILESHQTVVYMLPLKYTILDIIA
jgi:hypothetical protein